MEETAVGGGGGGGGGSGMEIRESEALEQQADARYEDIGPVVINVRTHYKRPNEQLVACHGFLRGIQIGDKLTGINDIG